MNADKASQVLDQFSKQRILVVGDQMWDRFIYGSVSRISPEAPVPVVGVEREHHMPGGASNVVRNIRAMGADADVAGLVGKDDAGDSLAGFFRENGVGVQALVQSSECRTTLKTRIIAENQHVVRVDWDNDQAMSSSLANELIRVIKEEMGQSTGVIIEDYGKGVVCQEVVDAVIKEAGKRNIPVGFDPKDNHELKVKGITVATPNRKEAFHAVGQSDMKAGNDPLQDEVLLKVGSKLLKQWGPRHLLITLGAQGMLLLDKDGPPRHVPTRAREVFDVSGAGDTVVAACVLALAAGADCLEAAEIANHASGVVVGHLGTATCSSDEILESIKRLEGDG